MQALGLLDAPPGCCATGPRSGPDRLIDQAGVAPDAGAVCDVERPSLAERLDRPHEQRPAVALEVPPARLAAVERFQSTLDLTGDLVIALALGFRHRTARGRG